MKSLASWLGILAALGLVFCLLGFLLSRLMKSGIVKGLPTLVKKTLKAANRFVHKHHKSVGIVATIVVMVHMIVCIGPLHHPSATGFIAFGLMLLLVMNGKRKIKKNWLHVHRSLAAVLSVVLVVHVLSTPLVA